MAKTMVGGQEKTYKRGMTYAEYTPWVKHFGDEMRNTPLKNGDFLSDYVNNATVRDILHIPEYAPGWSMCWGEDFNYFV